MPVIDMVRTGKRIQALCRVNGYSVKKLQAYLQIGCPQSIYNWYCGKSLPSLDHLLALSMLLHIPMNWMLITTRAMPGQSQRWQRMPQIRRMAAYRRAGSRQNTF